MTVKKEVDEAVKYAKADVEIGTEELSGDIYAEPLESQIRGTTPFNPLNHIKVGQAVNL